MGSLPRFNSKFIVIAVSVILLLYFVVFPMGILLYDSIMVNGAINFGYTGLVQNEAGWWYVVNGQLDFGYTGTVNWNGATYRVVNGNVVF